MSTGHLDYITHRFAGGFPDAPVPWRTVGRESEFPLVRADGTAGDLAALWGPVQAAGPALTEKREPCGLLVELSCDRYAIVSEVGKGTVEVVTAPCQDLHEIREIHEEARARLLLGCAEAGLQLLGYGIQPVTPPSTALMTPKQRYGVLHDAIGDDWLYFALTASDQVHVHVARDELLALTNLGHILTPVVVALCANSPVFAGQPCGAASAREQLMGRIGAARHRHGIPSHPDEDFHGFVRRLLAHPVLTLKRDGRYVPGAGRMLDRVLRGEDTDMEQLYADFLMHEHYIWNSARPRSGHGTLEFRAACQQPLGEHMTAAALSVAFVAAAPSLGRFLDRALGDEAWAVMRAWADRVMREGLAAPEPVSGLIDGVLERCEAGLADRGRGEEVYLAPLRRRLEAGHGPASRALRAFHNGGLEGLVTHAASPHPS